MSSAPSPEHVVSHVPLPFAVHSGEEGIFFFIRIASLSFPVLYALLHVSIASLTSLFPPWVLPPPPKGTLFGWMYVQPLQNSRFKPLMVCCQGLRGIASVLVVTAHICRSLVPHLLSPAMSDKLPPTLFQLPFLRCLVMGRASVAIFALVTGYVNSLGPLKKSRAGNADAALSGVAKSAFRRFGRFMIPAMVATTFSWLACQFGAYSVAHVANSAWIRDTSPAASASFAGAFYDLFKNLGTTWIDGMNQYDRIQWTLTYLLKGSMMTYLSLFALIYVKPRWRMAIIAGMFCFKWESGDCKQHQRIAISETDIG